MSLLERLPHLATAKRRKRVKDTMGGIKDTYPTILFTNRTCWQQPLSSNEISDWMKKGIEVTHKVYFATDPSLDEGCVLEIGTDRFDVMTVSDPDASAGLGFVYRVTCKKQST